MRETDVEELLIEMEGSETTLRASLRTLNHGE
jgi:hypothetical protein